MPEATSHVSVLGTERPPPADAQRVGPADPDQELTVSIQVRRRPGAPDLPDLTALGSVPPRERQRPDRQALAASHGADQDELRKVEAFAAQRGLKVVESDVARRTVRVSGTVAQMNRAFGVQLNTYTHPGGTYRSREGHVHVPQDLAGIVERVSGLTDRPLASPRLRARPHKVSSFPAHRVAELYDFPTTATGAGTCIGIVELGGGYSQGDLDAFFASAGVPTPQVVSVGVDGAGNSFGDPEGADVEVELDIEIAGVVAPDAKIAVYFAPNTEQGFIDAIQTAVFDTQNHPDVLSISWGLAEDGGWTAAGLSGMHAAFAAAAAAGVTVLAASGDNGSHDNVSDTRAHCDYPASDPLVLACGGTTLHVGDSGQLTGEVVWQDGFGGATGGGISAAFPRPPWQSGLDLPPSANEGAPAGRGLPDVTGDADPATGYEVVADGNHTVVGGTSAVAPLYAGLLTLITSEIGVPVGYINPFLYGLAGSNTFVDITSGNNIVAPSPGYTARQGWDACSGLGRINGRALLTAINQ